MANADLSGILDDLAAGRIDTAEAGRRIEAAKRDHPDLFKNVEFLYEDSAWDAKTSVSAFNRLRNEPGVGLIYNWGNPTTEAIAPLA